MPKLLNFALLSNPYNWIVVILMVTIFAFAWGLIDPLATRPSVTIGTDGP